jgi:ubiquinone/menaquinone biosynthesis C-methylase UbiE
MSVNLYKNTAQFYDGGNDRSLSEDISFYKTFIQDGCRILDVGCGTGRVAMALAHLPIEVTGIDYSQEMLNIFQEKLSKHPLEISSKIEIHCYDMTDFKLNDKFDLIIFPFRVFQVLQTTEQKGKCLETIKRHLAPEGKIIINVFNPNLKLLANFTGLKKMDYSYYDDKLRLEVTRYSQGEWVNFDKKTLSSKYIFETKDSDGNISIIEDRIQLGFLNKTEMDQLFIQNQLKIENLYSWWDFTPYEKGIYRELIYVLS